VRVHRPPTAAPKAERSARPNAKRPPKSTRQSLRAERAAAAKETVRSLIGTSSTFAAQRSVAPKTPSGKLTPARRKELCSSCFELRVELERLRRRCADLESRGAPAASAPPQLPLVATAHADAAMQLHVIKERALMQSVKALQAANEQLQREAKEHRRSRLIKRLAEQVRQQELVVDVLKQRVCDGGGAMKMKQVNDFLIKKTIGGPKRFRPQSREELEQAVVVLKGRVSHAKQSGRGAIVEVKQLRLAVKRLERDAAENAAAAAGEVARIGDAAAARAELQQKVIELSASLEDVHVRSRAKDSIIRRRATELDELRSEVERLDHANAASVLAKARLEEAQHALGRERETVATLQQTIMKHSVEETMAAASLRAGSSDQLEAVMQAHTEARNAERREHAAKQGALEESLALERRAADELRERLRAAALREEALRAQLAVETNVEATLRTQLAATTSVEAELRHQLVEEEVVAAGMREQLASDHAVEAAMHDELAAEAAREAALREQLAAGDDAKAALEAELLRAEADKAAAEASLADAKTTMAERVAQAKLLKASASMAVAKAHVQASIDTQVKVAAAAAVAAVEARDAAAASAEGGRADANTNAVAAALDRRASTTPEALLAALDAEEAVSTSAAPAEPMEIHEEADEVVEMEERRTIARRASTLAAEHRAAEAARVAEEEQDDLAEEMIRASVSCRAASRSPTASGGATETSAASDATGAPTSPRAVSQSARDAERLALRLAKLDLAAAGCNDAAASAADIAPFAAALRAQGEVRATVLAAHGDAIASRFARTQRCSDRWRHLWLKQVGEESEERWRVFNRNVRTLIDAKQGKGIFGRSITVLHPVGVAARWRKQRMRARLFAVLLDAERAANPKAPPPNAAQRNQLSRKAMRMVNKYGNEELKLFAAVSSKYSLAEGVPEWSTLMARYPSSWPAQFENGAPGRAVRGEMHVAAVVVQTIFRQHRDTVHAKVHAAHAHCKSCSAASNWHFLCGRVMEPMVKESAEKAFGHLRRQLQLLIAQSQGRGILGRSVNPEVAHGGLVGIAARWRRRRLVARLTAFYSAHLPPTYAAPKSVPKQVRRLIKKYGDHELKLCASLVGKYGVDVPAWPVPAVHVDALHELARLPLDASDVDAAGGAEAVKRRVRVIRRHLYALAIVPQMPESADYFAVDILAATIVQTCVVHRRRRSCIVAFLVFSHAHPYMLSRPRARALSLSLCLPPLRLALPQHRIWRRTSAVRRCAALRA
jgi:hypothetical protein